MGFRILPFILSEKKQTMCSASVDIAVELKMVSVEPREHFSKDSLLFSSFWRRANLPITVNAQLEAKKVFSMDVK